MMELRLENGLPIIGTIILPSFKLQLGMTREPYGFDGILGIDFMTVVGIKVDFKKMSIGYD